MAFRQRLAIQLLRGKAVKHLRATGDVSHHVRFLDKAVVQKITARSSTGHKRGGEREVDPVFSKGLHTCPLRKTIAERAAGWVTEALANGRYSTHSDAHRRRIHRSQVHDRNFDADFP